MKNLGILLLAALVLSSCGDGKNSNIEQGQVIGATADLRMTVSGRVDNSNGSVRFEEPRFNNNGTPMKLWSYGNAFAALGGYVTFREHANSACALLAGQNSRYETHNESGNLAYLEPGVVLKANGIRGGMGEVIKFGEIDLPYWRANTSKYMQSITCGNGSGFRNQPRPQRR